MRSLMMLIVVLLVAPVSADELIISEWLIQGPVPFEDGADPFDTPRVQTIVPSAGVRWDPKRVARRAPAGCSCATMFLLSFSSPSTCQYPPER